MREINFILDELLIKIEENKDIKINDKYFYIGLLKAVKIILINKH